ncbi:hypothetical protein G9A89_015151 [Geosiphon pyriformis]|nr:hypothetical protein G9A89_015151 [Geosiphon pyriformis]
MAASNSLLVTVVGGMLLVSAYCWLDPKLAVFEWFKVDRLLVAVVNILRMAAVNILLVAAVDKLGSDILVLNKLVAASLADKCFGIDLDFDIDFGFGIGNWGFDVDFSIISYKHCSWLLCDLVYYSCGKHRFFAATVDYLTIIDMLDFGNNWCFPDYCIFGELASSLADSKSLACVTGA